MATQDYRDKQLGWKPETPAPQASSAVPLPGLTAEEDKELRMLSKMTLGQAGHRGWERISHLYGKVLDALGVQIYG